MRTRPTLRTFCRWMLTILTAMLVVVWIGSGWNSFSISPDWPSGSREIQPALAFENGNCAILIDHHDEQWHGLFTFGWNIRKADSFDLRIWTWFHQRTNRSFVLIFPAWLPTLLLAIPTTLMWRIHIRTRRRITNVCTKCGYDKQGLGATSICPECGTPALIDHSVQNSKI